MFVLTWKSSESVTNRTGEGVGGREGDCGKKNEHSSMNKVDILKCRVYMMTTGWGWREIGN